MKTLLTILFVFGALASCRTTQSPTNHDYNSGEDRQSVNHRAYQRSAMREVLEKADEFIQSGIRYYNSGHFQDAMLQFIEAHRLMERYDATIPMVRARLNKVKGYLTEIYARHSNMAVRYANQLIDRGKALLSLGTLERAEAILESVRRWQPGLRNEVDVLLRRVRDAKRAVRQELKRRGYS